MTVAIPAGGKSGAFALQAEITNLASRTDTFSQNLLLQRQINLVSTLMDQDKLFAADILSTVPYVGTVPALAQITQAQAVSSAQATLHPGISAGLDNITIPALQVQAVIELMNAGKMIAGTVLSTMSYIGSAQ